MVKIYTQKTTEFESIILTHIHMEDQWQDGQNTGGKKNKQHKRENVDTNKDMCLMKYKVLKKAVRMKDYGKNQWMMTTGSFLNCLRLLHPPSTLTIWCYNYSLNTSLQCSTEAMSAWQWLQQIKIFGHAKKYELLNTQFSNGSL